MRTIDARMFVTFWQRARSVKAVARKMKMSPGACTVYASALRKKGVPLKMYRKRDSIAALAKLARELMPMAKIVRRSAHKGPLLPCASAITALVGDKP